jgi:hypothetical protein
MTPASPNLHRLAVWSVYLAIVALAGGCSLASPTFTKQTDPQPTPATKPTDAQPSPTADQQGFVNAALQYQSVLPVGMVVLLAILSFYDKSLMGWIVWLSHRREVWRIKKNGGGAPLA